jgi:hypothetical protein
MVSTKKEIIVIFELETLMSPERPDTLKHLAELSKYATV